jgi:hypothetical protein
MKQKEQTRSSDVKNIISIKMSTRIKQTNRKEERREPGLANESTQRQSQCDYCIKSTDREVPASKPLWPKKKPNKQKKV